MSKVLKELGMVQCQAENCIFRGIVKDSDVLLALFVDDGLVASKSEEALYSVMNVLKDSFEIKFGNSSNFVGMQIERNRAQKSIFICQQSHVEQKG